MSDRMMLFNDKCGGYENRILVVNIYEFIKKNNLKILTKEPIKIEEVWQSPLLLKICEYIKNGKLKF
jgi:hypothetical protein